MPMPTTVSTWTPRTEQGKHVFRIAGYSHHRGIKIDGFIKSGEFSVGGHSWIFTFGRAIDELVVFGLWLESEEEAPDVHASFEVRLVDQTTGLSISVHKEAPRTFSPEGFGKACIRAEERSVFEASNYLRDDCLVIECIVAVIRDPLTSETRSVTNIEVPPSNIGEHFGKLLEEKEGVDVTFSVGGETFTAHKIVLATRSPVFKAELYGPMSEAGTEPITIKDMQPAVFRALLYFIYTDSLPDMDHLEGDDHSEMIRHLLVAADRYDIERLKLMCQNILCENLRVQTVATTLVLADQHHCDMLNNACIEFITCSNVMDAVAATQGYKSLKRSCPSVVIEALEKASRIRKA